MKNNCVFSVSNGITIVTVHFYLDAPCKHSAVLSAGRVDCCPRLLLSIGRVDCCPQAVLTVVRRPC